MADDKNGKSGDNGKLLYCSFCGKSQHEVRKLIAGPSVFISVMILSERKSKRLLLTQEAIGSPFLMK